MEQTTSAPSAPSVLSKGTLVPLGVVLSIGGGVVYALLEAVLAFQGITHAVEINTGSVDAVRAEVEKGNGARLDMALRLSDLEQWIIRFSDLNPEIKIPSFDR